jgi:hypothetical protein
MTMLFTPLHYFLSIILYQAEISHIVMQVALESIFQCSFKKNLLIFIAHFGKDINSGRLTKFYGGNTLK